MALKTVATLLLLMFQLSSPRLLCGVELVTSNLMEMFVKLDCPELYGMYTLLKDFSRKKDKKRESFAKVAVRTWKG